MNLQHIYNLCTQLQSITSTKAKQQFLLDNRCDEFDEFLKWLLDPQIVTGIDRKKLKKKVDVSCFASFDYLDQALYYLQSNNTGRDVDVYACQRYISSNPDYADFLTAVFTKSLKLGVDVKLVNKAYGDDFIFNWEVQQAYPIEKYPLKPNEWITITQKCNGVRATYYRGKIMARSGVEFKGLDHILATLDAYPELVFDGELMLKDKTGLTDNEAFRKATGIINSDEDKSEICMTVFDIIPLADFESSSPKVKYSKRREMFNGFVDADNVKFLPTLYQGTDHSQIPILLDKMVAEDKEGLMVNLDVPYKRKRHSGILKVKRFYTMDLRVVSIEEGEGKYVGMLGKVNVEFNGNVVGVGSGFTDEQRIKYWEDKDYLVNKIIEVKYKEVSTDKKTGLQSLQFPVFVCEKFDKTKPNYEQFVNN